MAWEYSDKTKLMFMNAIQGDSSSHYGVIEDPDGVGEHGSIACGDAMRLMFKVNRATNPVDDVITEIRYTTFGCTSAIAASEALCAIITAGTYTPIEALRITNDDIVQFLGRLPSQKIHCSVMGAEALEATVVDWAKRRGVDLSAHGVEVLDKVEDESRVVCHCFEVTEDELRRSIRILNLRTVEDITYSLKAGGACGACIYEPGGLQDLLDEQWGRVSGIDVSNMKIGLGKGELSPYQFSKLVEEVLAEDVAPMLHRDGGGVELIDIKGHMVYVALIGACANCPGAASTLQHVIEKILREKVSEDIKVIEV